MIGLEVKTILSPDYLLHVSEGAEEIASALHSDIVNRIVERIMLRVGRGEGYLLTATDKWNIEVLQESGYLLEDIQKEIAERTNLQQKEIKEAMEDAGVTALRYDDAIYKAAGLSPTPLEESPYMVRLMQRDYEATMGEWKNFTRTTANAAQNAFIEACDKAYHLTSSGAVGYTQAVMEAINDIVKNGVYVKYPSGHTDTIETATLRCVRTGISQATAAIQTARMDEMNWDIVLVSSHLGARVTGKQDYTDHAWWQGKFYSRSGKDSRFPPFSVCGEGNVQGICGANCRHSFGPGDGEDNPFDQYDSEENKKAYEIQQKQRRMERNIRSTKREAMAEKTALDNADDPALKSKLQEEYERTAALLQKQNNAYNEFCAENDLKRLNDRLAVAQWDRQQAAAARGAALKHHKGWLKSIGAESTELNTLNKYYAAQKENSREYELLTGYKKAVNKGDISPLVGFDQYKVTAAAIDAEIVGKTAANGVKIESYTTHFIDRVIGQVSEPHQDKRLGVPIPDVIEALTNPTNKSEPYYVDNDLRQSIVGKNARVVVSISDKRIIQTNPRGEK